MTLRKALDLYPEKIAVIDGDRSYTYQQIGERVAGLARFFQNRGIHWSEIEGLPVTKMTDLPQYCHPFARNRCL